MSRYIERFNSFYLLGGEVAFQMETDESLMTHYGPNEGLGARRTDRQVWAIGLIERETKIAKSFIVNNRTAETLLSIILTNVRVGSTIYSDSWPGYNRLGELGYNHVPEIHQDFQGLNTNRIENLGSVIKRIRNNIYSGSIDANGSQEFLNELIGRRYLEISGSDAKFNLIEIIRFNNLF